MARSGAWLRDSPGDILSLFRERKRGLTKAETMRLTGLSRTAISARIDALAQSGIITTHRIETNEIRGRPAERFELDPGFGSILVADTGATGMRVAVFDARGTIRSEGYEAFDIAEGPDRILARITTGFERMIAELGPTRILGIGIDLPGPVDLSTRRTISPPIMTGWHNYDISGYFTERFHCAVVIEKDTNAMAYGEQRREYPNVDELLFVKLGTGIGTGMIVRGELFRGADGAAGDIGHSQFVHFAATDAPLCRCGNVGCLEAYAGGWAMARDLTEAGFPCASVNDVVTLVREGNGTALGVVRQASEMIGMAVADIVNMINPRMLVFGGQLAELDEIVLATVRRVIYGRSLPLASRNLSIVSTRIEDPGVFGLAELVADEVFSSEHVDDLLKSQPAAAAL